MARDITIRKYRIGEEPVVDADVARMTPGERVSLVWEITKSVWAWKTGTLEEPVFRRDVAHVIRPTGAKKPQL